MMKAPFQPTQCSCKADQASCRRQPGHLLPDQLRTIMSHLGKTLADAHRYFWNSPGMVIMNSEQRIPFRVRTITPRWEDGQCIFFQEGRCSIHAVAPFGCRYFDVHMTAHKAHRRAQWGVRQILSRLDEYARERDSLPEATHYDPKSVL